jgi:hypothetical protein
MPKCRRRFVGLLCLAVLLAAAGCASDRLPTAPVEGKVLYHGKPLEFGGVLVQPTSGPPARGTIQPDGTFRLSTYRDGDGAVLGQHAVQITCYDNQRPGGTLDTSKEPGVGKSLIPAKYARHDTSGERREVRQENNSFTFELTD